MPIVDVRLLGGVEVLRDGVPDDAGYPRQRMVLAALAVDVGRAVSLETLLERVWDGAAPRTAGNTVQSYISRLRKLFDTVDGVGIDRTVGGYVLAAKPESVDLHRFRGLIARARATADDDVAQRRYDEALGLWHGEPFAGFGTIWFGTVRERLAAEHHAASLDRNDVLLRLGGHDALVTALPDAVHAHPFDERLAGQLMLALYRSGRQADALDHYARLRGRLVTDLGNDPGPELRELHRRILVGDVAAPAPTVATSPVPRQLPAAPRLFTGRDKELGRLDVGHEADGSPIWVISGPGGIGKTWLALRWANERLDRFPDGQLYLNLHGFHPTEDPVAPDAALAQALDALGVPAAAIPADTETRTARYRSLLAGKRVLIVLDNARDAEQVLPLLPGGADCATLVTSRRDLPGLGAAHGARPLRLSTLDDDQARRTLARHMGEQRLAEEPAAVAKLIEACDGLPLAVGILGARAAAHDDIPLSALAEELRDHADRLDVLDSGDLDVGLRAVFDGSFRALDADEARMFALLGSADLRDIGQHAAASLTGLPLGRTRTLLRGLETANLIEQYVPGRYRMHDLTRLYAAERAVTDREASRRLVCHYLHTAFRMDELCAPVRDRAELGPGEFVDGCHRAPFADQPGARQWLKAERTNIPLIQSIALEHGWYTETWRLAWCCTFVLWFLNHPDDVLVSWRIAREATERLDDPVLDAMVESFLGRALNRAGQPADGARHLKRALRSHETGDDRVNQAVILMQLGRCHEQLNDAREALACSKRALRLIEEASATRMLGRAHNAVGWYHALLGDFHTARIHCEKALRLREDGPVAPLAMSDVLDSLGYIEFHSGRYAAAIDYYTKALNALGEGWGETVQPRLVEQLGDSHHAVGADSVARDTWRRALELYNSQHLVESADAVAAKLAALAAEPDD